MELTSFLSVSSWLLLLIIGLLTICLLKSLLPKRSIDIGGKYVLITGCDSGFGRATAIRLDEMGVRVLATCLTSDGEKGLKSVTSDRLKTFQMDVTNSQQIKEVFEEVKKEVACGRSLGYALCPCFVDRIIFPGRFVPSTIFERKYSFEYRHMV